MDDSKQTRRQEQEAEPRRPDDADKDLAPEAKEGEDVKGGASLNFTKVVVDY